MNHKKLFKPLLLATAAALALPALAQQTLTVVNFGGANGAAQKKAYFEAYEKATGGKITQVEYNGEQARVKAMVEAKKVTWDVVEVEGPDARRTKRVHAPKVCTMFREPPCSCAGCARQALERCGDRQRARSLLRDSHPDPTTCFLCRSPLCACAIPVVLPPRPWTARGCSIRW